MCLLFALYAVFLCMFAHAAKYTLGNMIICLVSGVAENWNEQEPSITKERRK